MLRSILSNLKSKTIFIKEFYQFNKFLGKSILNFTVENFKKDIYIIVLSPWKLTAVNWFSITVGLMLLKRGKNVRFLIDDLIFENRIDHYLQIVTINKTLKLLIKKGVVVEKLSNFKSKAILNIHETEEIEKLAFANAVHLNRGEDYTDEFKQLIVENKIRYETNFSTVKSYVEKYPASNYIIPGGVIANSGLFVSILKKKNCSFFTYDSGFGVMITCFKGIAAQLEDISITFDSIFSNKEEVEYAIIASKEELEKRKKGSNKFSNQLESIEKSKNFDEVGILFPLNSPWDSATLNIASVFESFNDWLIESVRIVLEHTDYKITVRQHPDERHWYSKSSTDFKNILSIKFNNNERIQFVSCYDEINSYALLEKANAVICYSSTFGIESVIANKPVCVCSTVYYSKFDFCFVPKTREDIVLFLNSIGSEKLTYDVNRASVAYYITQQCNWLFTPFTPATSDFKSWVKVDIEELRENPSILMYLESLENKLPLSYINHKSNFKNAKKISL